MDLNTPLVDRKGRTVFSYGGPNCYAEHNYRGYSVVMDWFVGARSTEPMMIIRDEKAGEDHGALGICLSSIGAYVDPDTPSNAAPGAFFRCVDQLDCLGKMRIPMEANLLLDVIQRYASDLILMPPTPRQVVRDAQPKAILDVTITDEATGKTHSELSI